MGLSPRSWLLLCLGAVVVLGAGYALNAWDRAGTRAASPREQRAHKALRSELTEVRRGQRRLEREVARLERVPRGRDESALTLGRATGPTEAPGEPPTIEEIERDTAAFVERLDRRWRTDPEDPAWASVTEEAILDVLHTRIGDDVDVRSIDCQGTVCKLEIDHASDSARRDFFPRVASAPEFRNEVFVQSVPGDGRRSVVYLGRDGAAILR